MSELSDNIEKLGPAHAILRGLIHFEILSLKILLELKFRLQIRIQRKISRRLICIDNGVMIILPIFH